MRALPRPHCFPVCVVLLALLCTATQSCYHYRVAAAGAAGANPSTFPRATTLHGVFWGLVQDRALENVCAQDEALSRVRTTSSFAYTLLTLVTLGIWAPLYVEYECANMTPPTGTIGGGTNR